jgi:hypothetical protein
MKLRPFIILLTIPLWACAAKPDGDPKAGSGAASTALSVIETPLLIAFKIPLCIATGPLLVPGAAASAVIPFKDAPKEPSGTALVTKGVTDACGPPYVATPDYGF